LPSYYFQFLSKPNSCGSNQGHQGIFKDYYGLHILHNSRRNTGGFGSVYLEDCATGRVLQRSLGCQNIRSVLRRRKTTSRSRKRIVSSPSGADPGAPINFVYGYCRVVLHVAIVSFNGLKSFSLIEIEIQIWPY